MVHAKAKLLKTTCVHGLNDDEEILTFEGPVKVVVCYCDPKKLPGKFSCLHWKGLAGRGRWL